MRIGITYDANSEARLDSVLDELMDQGFEAFFADKFYDDSGLEMFVVLMCRDPALDFKQRIRFVKKENCLYMDIMLDLLALRLSDSRTRKGIVAIKIITEVPQIIANKNFKDFDLPRFAEDLRQWFETHGWIGLEHPEGTD